MVGNGGMSVREWWHLRDTSLVPLYTDGLTDRHRDDYIIARWLCKVSSANAGNKEMLNHLNDIVFPFEERKDERTDEERQREWEEAIKKLKFD